jgi:hypothetical protein
MATTRKGRGAMVAGVLAIVGGIAVAVVMLLVAQARVDDAVGDLARAPSGCDTTLDVSEEGTYLFFVETEGSIDELVGGCDVAPDSAIEGDLPRVRLELTDPDGDEVDLDRVDDVTYDADGFAGTAIRQAELDRTGTYVLNVESPEDVVVSVGKDPDDAAGPFPALAVLVGLLGIVSGVVLLVAGAMARRRPEPVPQVPAQPWHPVPGTAPMGPPAMPVPGPPIAPPATTASPWARPPASGTAVPTRPAAGPPHSVFPPPPPPPPPPSA